MANGGLQRMMKKRLSKIKVEYKSNVNKFENPSDFGFAKKLSESNNIWIRTQSHTYSSCESTLQVLTLNAQSSHSLSNLSPSC